MLHTKQQHIIIMQTFDIQLERCLDCREKGERLKRKPIKHFFCVCGERGRWLAHVKFCNLEVNSISEQYSLLSAKLDGMSRHVS